MPVSDPKALKVVSSPPHPTDIFILSGLNAIPEFYGSTARHPQIDGFRSGLKEGGKSLFYGWADALTGLVTTPMRGHRKHVSFSPVTTSNLVSLTVTSASQGAAGAVGGVFASLLDLQLKPAFGMSLSMV